MLFTTFIIMTYYARGGRSCERFGGYKTINQIPLFIQLSVVPWQPMSGIP